MQLDISLDLGDGPFTVSTALPVWMAWEKQTGKTVQQLGSNFGMTDLAILAYEACKLHKVVVPATLEAFARKVVDGPNLEGTPDQQGPTEGAPTTDS